MASYFIPSADSLETQSVDSLCINDIIDNLCSARSSDDNIEIHSSDDGSDVWQQLIKQHSQEMKRRETRATSLKLEWTSHL